MPHVLLANNADRPRTAGLEHPRVSMVEREGNGSAVKLGMALLVASVIGVVVALASPARVCAAPATQEAAKADLSSLSIEELMNIEVEVTSASRKSQKLSETAAAVYVITEEDIRRTGATSIPEALRLAPGMDVARIDSNKWAVSCRGFNDLFGNKMLVLVDGRSVYTSTFSGVWWDTLGVMMSQVDRIEVVRGPGATLWGANAVDAIINIITKSASASQGMNAELLMGGADVRSSDNLSYGGTFGRNGHYDVHGGYTDNNNLLTRAGDPASDSWEQTLGGVRMDWQPAADTSMTCQLNAYNGTENQQVVTNLEYPMFSQIRSDKVSAEGSNFLTRWSRTKSADCDMALQLYYSHTKRLDDIQYDETCDTYDLDFQHRSVAGGRHEIIWGMGYRQVIDEASGSRVMFNPTGSQDHLLSAFVQDEIPLSEHLRLTFGSKFEHNDSTGFETQPNIRFCYTPRQHETIWGAVSRAVRTPARIERDSTFYWDIVPNEEGGLDYIGSVGNPAYGSEDLIAYELGYRRQPSPDLSFDLAAYYNDYPKLMCFQWLAPVADGIDNYYLTTEINGMSGSTCGIELATSWRANTNWKLTGSYSTWRADLSVDPSTGDTTSVPLFEGSSPQRQFSLRSYLDLPHNLTLDSTLYLREPASRKEHAGIHAARYEAWLARAQRHGRQPNHRESAQRTPR